MTLLNFSACPIQTIGLASDYAFPNSSFTASSSSAGNEAFKGRLNGDGAWLPSTNDDANDYLQVDLQNEHFICAVATQGNPNARHWTRTYKLLLSLNSADWVTYQENSTDKVCMLGNAGQTPLMSKLCFSGERLQFVSLLSRLWTCSHVLLTIRPGLYQPWAHNFSEFCSPPLP